MNHDIAITFSTAYLGEHSTSTNDKFDEPLKVHHHLEEYLLVAMNAVEGATM